MNRKTFILKSAGVLLIAAPSYALLSCSGSSDDGSSPNPNPNPQPQANCLNNGTNSSISANHGHTLTVSKEDVNAAVEKTYDIKGNSPHAHSVTISASQFNSLKSNNQITVTSTTGDAHTHNITVSCA